MERIDADQHAEWPIARVAWRRQLDDVRRVLSVYGVDQVRGVAPPPPRSSRGVAIVLEPRSVGRMPGTDRTLSAHGTAAALRACRCAGHRVGRNPRRRAPARLPRIARRPRFDTIAVGAGPSEARRDAVFGSPGELWMSLWRTAVLWAVALAVFRLVGKRTLGKMGAFDFAVIIMMGDPIMLLNAMEGRLRAIWAAVAA